MGNNALIQQVLVLFLIIVVGFIAKKKDIITSQVSKKLSELLLYITSPFLVITSFNFEFSFDMLTKAIIVFIFSMGIHIFSIILGMFAFNRYPDRVRSVLRFITVFPNCGFMGFPVLESIFGKIGIFYGSIYVMVFNIFLWTYGVMLFSKDNEKTSIKQVLFNPGTISVFIGIIVFLFSIDIPAPIYNTLDLVGGMTAPLSMLIVGALLADVDFKKLFSGSAVYYGSFIRLIFIPLLTMVVLKFTGMEEELMKICVLLVAMPAAANTAIFAEKYDADAPLASQCIAVSTIFSMITMPLILSIM